MEKLMVAVNSWKSRIILNWIARKVGSAMIPSLSLMFILLIQWNVFKNKDTNHHEADYFKLDKEDSHLICILLKQKNQGYNAAPIVSIIWSQCDIVIFWVGCLLEDENYFVWSKFFFASCVYEYYYHLSLLLINGRVSMK
jgi:hypothetical protein